MEMLVNMFLRYFFNRRHSPSENPVGLERRAKPITSRQAADHLLDSIDRLEKTVRMKREDFEKIK